MNYVNSDLAYKDYKKGMKYKDIAAKYGVTLNTVKSWQKRHGWRRDAKYKGGAPKGNKYALGNNGGPPLGSSNAAKHELYSKYLPRETLNIFEAFENKSPAEILWDAIMLKYAALIRAQKIMYTEKDAKRQASFLGAQAKAMSSLTQMLKQYEDMKPDGEAAYRIQKLKAEIGGAPKADDVSPLAGLTTEELKRLANDGE